MKVQVDYYGFEPTRAHSTDAGIDLRSPISTKIPAGGYVTIKTGVHVELPKGTCGLLVSKSGLNVNHHITSTGLIDEGFSGEIAVKLYNSGGDYFIQRGDKISQLVVLPVLYEDIEIVDEINQDTERGNNGFGSSGR